MAQKISETEMKTASSSTNFSIKDMRSLIDIRLRIALSPISLTILDDSASHSTHSRNSIGGHYSVIIVSPEFNGKSSLLRHRMVYDALSDVMQSNIHALAISTYTQEEFNK